jgi:anthranilate O-methyltransferase
VQFFLNNLPGNDFNLVFQSLELFKKLAAKEKGEASWAAGILLHQALP